MAILSPNVFPWQTKFGEINPSCQFHQYFTSRFFYKRVLISFSSLTVGVCIFLAKGYWQKNLIVKCWRNWLQVFLFILLQVNNSFLLCHVNFSFAFSLSLALRPICKFLQATSCWPAMSERERDLLLSKRRK